MREIGYIEQTTCPSQQSLLGLVSTLVSNESSRGTIEKRQDHTVPEVGILHWLMTDSTEKGKVRRFFITVQLIQTTVPSNCNSRLADHSGHQQDYPFMPR